MLLQSTLWARRPTLLSSTVPQSQNPLLHSYPLRPVLIDTHYPTFILRCRSHTHTCTRLSPQDCTVLFLQVLSRAHNMPGALPGCSRTRKDSLHILTPFSAPTFWRHDFTSLAGNHAARSNGVMLQYYLIWHYKSDTKYKNGSQWYKDW